MSKQIPLTQGKYAIVDDEDYELASKFKWHIINPKFNCEYAQCTVYLGVIDGKDICSNMLLHRLILRPPIGKMTDHKNHNGLDCRIKNLRACTRGENKYNSLKHKKGTSQYKGVCWHKSNNRWCARITWLGKVIHLGNFKDEKKAARVYDEYAKRYHKEFAELNFK